MFRHFSCESFAGRQGYYLLDRFDLPIPRQCRIDTSLSWLVDRNLAWTIDILVQDKVFHNFTGYKARRLDCQRLGYQLGMKLRMYYLGLKSRAGRERMKALSLQGHKLYNSWYLEGKYRDQVQDWHIE